MRLRLEPPRPVRLVGDLLARLSMDRLERGGDPLPAEQLQAAAERGPDELERVALAYALRLGAPRFTLPTMARLAGLPPAQAARLWLALGFAQPDDREAVFTDGDLVALGELRRVVADEDLDPADVTQLARLVGQSFARISDALVGILQHRVVERLGDDGAEGSELAVALAATAGSPALGAVDDLLSYAWKRHLAAAIRRAALRAGTGTDDASVCVGFADIAGFTRLSAGLDDRQLTRIIESFHRAVDDAVVQGGGRVVKTLGDEVMFVADGPDVGASIAAQLAAGFRRGEDQIDLHVGLAWGPVLCRDGDYYGHTVNVASRLTDAAPAGGVLVDAGVVNVLEATGVGARTRSAPVAMAGLGRVDAWLLDGDRR